MFKFTVVVFNQDKFFSDLVLANKSAAKAGMAPFTHGDLIHYNRAVRPVFRFDILVDEWWEVEIYADTMEAAEIAHRKYRGYMQTVITSVSSLP